MAPKLVTKDKSPDQQDLYINRQEALKLLGIKAQTLYSYVSRGWIRSVRKPGGGKISLYASEDIEKVKARAEARTGHGVAASGAMRWGEPIIPTSITEITSLGPRYRGHSAVELARSGASFESVADLLWTGLWFEEIQSWRIVPLPSSIPAITQSVLAEVKTEGLMEVFTLVTLHLGLSRGTMSDRIRAASPVEAARQIIQSMVGCMGLLGPRRAFTPMIEGESVAVALLRILEVDPSDENKQAMEAILVLLADHELTTSTFAARVAASAGALLHGCMTAALATNSGIEIGRLYDRVEALLPARLDAAGLLKNARVYQDRGGTPPGFNHPIYPRGDPRADYLLQLAAARSRRPARLEHLLGFLSEARKTMQLYPRVEMGVLALSAAMRLPPMACGALFTVARTSGWVAHVLEQRTAAFLLRPRAKYLMSGQS
jgi:citrate synthase